ncbi:hypothetical protein BaRGS_00017524 [Batillaria attramentaria]|uniref:Uncharacterized protein n=1 Tax=Batillaria attramentaria TaxID=370345 RepID=A0ABD0KWE6_9CAEN
MGHQATLTTVSMIHGTNYGAMGRNMGQKNRKLHKLTRFSLLALGGLMTIHALGHHATLTTVSMIHGTNYGAMGRNMGQKN